MTVSEHIGQLMLSTDVYPPKGPPSTQIPTGPIFEGFGDMTEWVTEPKNLVLLAVLAGVGYWLIKKK